MKVKFLGKQRMGHGNNIVVGALLTVSLICCSCRTPPNRHQAEPEEWSLTVEWTSPDSGLDIYCNVLKSKHTDIPTKVEVRTRYQNTEKKESFNLTIDEETASKIWGAVISSMEQRNFLPRNTCEGKHLGTGSLHVEISTNAGFQLLRFDDSAFDDWKERACFATMIATIYAALPVDHVDIERLSSIFQIPCESALIADATRNTIKKNDFKERELLIWGFRRKDDLDSGHRFQIRIIATKDHSILLSMSECVATGRQENVEDMHIPKGQANSLWDEALAIVEQFHFIDTGENIDLSTMHGVGVELREGHTQVIEVTDLMMNYTKRTDFRHLLSLVNTAMKEKGYLKGW